MSDRKYGQKGYQDSGRREAPRSKGPQGPPPHHPVDRPEGPRGRGLGQLTASAFKCGACGKAVEIAKVATDSACPWCQAPLHTCSTCVSFDPGAPMECRQTPPVRIASKTKANECPLFAPKAVAGHEAERGGTRDARSAFDALFKF
jgi:predicted RNA-binding Zn-ribbon protein involved in translation (DUF1610 family)